MSRVEFDHSGAQAAAAAGFRPTTPADPAHVRLFEQAKVEPVASVSPIKEEMFGKTPQPTVEGDPTKPDGSVVRNLAAQLLGLFGSQGAGGDQDRHNLKAKIKEVAPFSRQQERMLLAVSDAIKGVEGSHYLASMINAELRQIIQRNAMVNHMLQYSHKLDLEP